eukprot:GFUD01008922.1.p1 GENE.GFUD01008922.1~~GFUD01008922.1.p1  ORF type:complete len:834 (-),score=220.43 GFUD01008922.1:54-2555(-)
MSFFTSIVRNFKEFYSEINAATLTGAIDVIVVEQEDGTFKSSPFHVRFGKLGVLKAREKIVDLEVNGEPVDIQMKLDDTGVAFFVELVKDGDDNESWAGDLATSPIPEQSEWMTKAKRETEKISDKYISREAQTEVIKEAIKIETKNGKHKKKKQRRKNFPGHSRNSSKTSFKDFMPQDLFPMDDLNDADQEDYGEDLEINIPRNLSCDFAKWFDPSASTTKQFKRSDSCKDEVCNFSLIPKSSSEAEALKALIKESRHEVLRPMSVAAGFHYFSDGEIDNEPSPLSSRPVSPMLSDSEYENQKREEEEQNVWRWGELPNTANNSMNVSLVVEKVMTTEVDDNMRIEEHSLSKICRSRNEEKEEIPSVYLDDILDDPDKLALYLNPMGAGPSQEPVPQNDPLDLSDVPRGGVDVLIDEDCESGHLSLPMSPRSGMQNQNDPAEVDPNNFDPNNALVQLIIKHLPDLAASMCGGLSDASITMEKFESELLTYPEFLCKLRNPQLFIHDPKLVIRVHEKYMSWSIASPILFSVIMFEKPLPQEHIDDIIKDCVDVNFNLSAEEVRNNREKIKKSSTWFGWFSGSGNSELKNNEEASRVDMSCQTEAKDIPNINSRSRHSSEETENENQEERHENHFRKTLRLNNARIAEMNLMPGRNEVEFSVTTAFQGTTRCKCHIFLWHHSDKVVISDIDGTITKSDVLGHILPVIGNDWAQSGVAQLFTKIRNNGYQIMYLSARAIGQASITKDYLQSVKQGDVCLPDGPIFLNPDSLYYAFRREVIDRNPEEFKIRCLKDIHTIFEEKNPFFAGYGNRPNDAFAYRAVGIPVSRIFTINPA